MRNIVRTSKRTCRAHHYANNNNNILPLRWYTEQLIRSLLPLLVSLSRCTKQERFTFSLQCLSYHTIIVQPVADHLHRLGSIMMPSPGDTSFRSGIKTCIPQMTYFGHVSPGYLWASRNYPGDNLRVDILFRHTGSFDNMRWRTGFERRLRQHQ